MISNRLSILLAFLMPVLLMAQSAERAHIGATYLSENYAELGLTQDDVKDVVITDNYMTKHNGFSHIYYAQTYNGVKVHNALFNVTLDKEGKVLFSGNRFVSDLRAKINPADIKVSPEAALLALTDNLGYKNVSKPVKTLSRSSNADLLMFEEAEYSSGLMTAEPYYYRTSDGRYTLAWQVFIEEKASPDSWYAYINAATGEFIDKKQNSHQCTLHKGMFDNHSNTCTHEHHNHTHTAATTQKAALNSVDGSAYFVVGLPYESPTHGPFELISEPAIEAASPFGWHDEDGVEGPEWTITRGNNVHAYEDQNADDISSGNEPDGGVDLQFNFPYSDALDPAENADADVTGLFYMNNMIHDRAYLVGFDESAGAHQVNNYGNGGNGNDPVLAEALDGSGTNNANITPRPDGQSPRMQMFRWDFTPGISRILEPNVLSGEYDSVFETGANGWNQVPAAADVDVTAEMVIVSDSDPQNPNQGCGELINDVAGKIALIFRGSCEFGRKALNAEEAGAVAAIICNVPGVNGGDGEEPLGMLAGEFGANVTIPVLSFPNSTCIRIQEQLSIEPVIGQLRLIEVDGPTERSSGFDNGVIAHEYGHGIYERLIGGPNNITCSNGPELLSEGFTDYLGLILTVEPGDTGADIRGIGTFVQGESTTGRGIRRFPYSTDMSVNPQTYEDIIGQGTHARGEILTTLLWDVHWLFTDLYGYDQDFSNGDAGNVRGIRLAFDAMKMVPCNPTFIDIRNAILVLDGGEHECELWELFARRGLGFFADTGDLGDADDLTESFETRPSCIPTLKIQKDVPTLVVPGAEATVTFEIANHTSETATNVIVTDILDDGLTVAEGPAGIPFTQVGNEVRFEIGDLEPAGDIVVQLEFSYTLQTDPSIVSETLMLNTVESNDEQLAWDRDLGPNNQTNQNAWDLNANDAYSGTRSWFSQERDQDTDHRLIMSNFSVSGVRPVARFWHRINTEFITDGGFVEISNDNTLWFNTTDQFIRGGYNSILSFQILAIPNLSGFSGENPEGSFEDSYIDLSPWNGQDVSMRFRFSTQDVGNDGDMDPYPETNGWYIDDFELIDMKSYITNANISADNADMVETGEIEILINSDFTISTDNLDAEVDISVFPNPVNNTLNVGVVSDKNRDAQIQLTSLDGKVLQEQRVEFLKNENLFRVDVSAYQAGMYLLHIISDNRITTKKVVVE